MSVDLNKAAERLKKQQPVGVNRSGQISDRNPVNDGSRANTNGNTTLQPKRFFRLL